MTRTPEAIAAMRSYADDLRAAGAAYQTAANAAGMDRLKGRREAADYLTSEGQRLIRESRSVDQIADEWEAADAPDPEAVVASDPSDRYGYGQLADEQAAADRPVPIHTVGGRRIGYDGVPYGTLHDMECPGCKDTPFTASPRSETYWAS